MAAPDCSHLGAMAPFYLEFALHAPRLVTLCSHVRHLCARLRPVRFGSMLELASF
jgi:hypothetical protein